MQKRVQAVIVISLIVVWLSGMTAGLTAGACRNELYRGDKKLRFCNISLIAGFFLDYSSVDRAKRSIIHLERGIALSQVTRDEEARDAFKRAFQDAGGKLGRWLPILLERMATLNDRQAQAVWQTVVE